LTEIENFGVILILFHLFKLNLPPRGELTEIENFGVILILFHLFKLNLPGAAN